jgi:hypothetical protein
MCQRLEKMPKRLVIDIQDMDMAGFAVVSAF